MRRVVSFLIAATALLGGCSDSAGVADCTVVIRYGDAIYNQDGFTKVVGSEVGMADLAGCDDTGENAQGPYFSEGDKRVQVWSIPGRNPASVVAIVDSGDTYRVMKATSNK